MAKLQAALEKKIPGWREELRALASTHGNQVIDQVTIGQALGGMRGVKGMVCDTSLVPPDEGLIIRGIPVGNLTAKTPEDIFYLLCTGELPTAKDRRALQEEFAARAKVPGYVWKVLEAMPANSHPMTMLDTAVLVMQRESLYVKAYDAGLDKKELWKPMLEDSLNLLARLPGIAAGIYRMRFGKGNRIAPKSDLDYAANFTRMLGIGKGDKTAADAIRLYLVLHCDHEGGNVSAHTCNLVSSALSDAYYSVSAGLNGLAGPLHGLANQECLGWVLDVRKRFKGNPTREQLEQFAWDTLSSGRVIPGYGHAVLRITDPRFTAFRAFGLKHFPDDPLVQMVDMVFQVVPEVLKKQGKAKDPWPNVDAASGAILYHYGMTEFPYYTVMFSVSRAMGMCAQLVWNRAVMAPIERPKTVTIEWLQKKTASPA
jgi:citrate synthase